MKSPGIKLSDGPQAQVSPDPLTLVLLGHTGAGKSASGNSILHREAFASENGFEFLTTEISEQTGTVGGQQVTVVDTPGIMSALQEVRALSQELKRSRKPYVFLFVQKIDRFTQEQEEALKSAMGAVGEEGLSRGLLLFTGADALGTMTLEEFINKDPDSPLVKVVQKFGDRVHMFNNNLRGSEKNQQENQSNQRNQEQVLQLMDKVKRIPKITENPGMTGRLEESRMVLLGLPGAGKSSSGNTILGSEDFEAGCDFGPVTSETFTRSAEVEGRRVSVVDTPGFYPKCMTIQEYFKQLVLSVIDTDPGPNAFVIVVRLGRISDLDLVFFKMLSHLFDKQLKYFTVLFTHGDRLKKKNIEELIEENHTIKELVSKCKGRYTVFSNEQSCNRRQVQDLLSRIDEISRDNEGMPYTLEMLFNNSNLVLENVSRSILPDDDFADLSDEECDVYDESLLSQGLTEPQPTPSQGLIDPEPIPFQNQPLSEPTPSQDLIDPEPTPSQSLKSLLKSLWKKVKNAFIWLWSQILSYFCVC